LDTAQLVFYFMNYRVLGTLTDKAENLNKLKLDASDQGKVPYNP